MSLKLKVYADFHNADPQGRLRLNCAGTLDDLTRLGVELGEGQALTFYSDDADGRGEPDELLADGLVTFSPQEHCWVAVIDWSAVRHASDTSESPAAGVTVPAGRSLVPADQAAAS